MREHPTPLPELGAAKDSSPRWNTSNGTPVEKQPYADRAFGGSLAEGPVQLRSDSELRERKVSRDSDDLEDAIRSPVRKVALLSGAVLIALGLVGSTYYLKHRPAQELVAPVAQSAPVSAPSASAAPGGGGAPGSRPSVDTTSALAEATPSPRGVEPPTEDPPVESSSSSRRSRRSARSRAGEAPSAQAEAPPDAAPDVGTGTERGGATQQSAAALYLKGQYKEALAEYRLLASAHPKEKAYAEFARILKRKMFETCVRTQPSRREQCKQI